MSRMGRLVFPPPELSLSSITPTTVNHWSPTFTCSPSGSRKKKSLKRGGDRRRVELDESILLATKEFCPDDLLALNYALDKLFKKDPVVADLVKLHYFAGLTLEQVALIQGISRRTAVKHLVYARVWLHREITKGDEPISR